MSLGKKLKILRFQKDLSLEQLAANLNLTINDDEKDLISFNKGKLSKWENGKEEPKLSALKYVADYYNVSIDSIINDDEFSNLGIPLLGKIAAGTPILAEENIEDYFQIDRSIKADFCLKIQGDSMIDEGINDGDIVFIKKQCTLENGQIGAILIEDEATLKIFYKDQGAVVLQPANKDYKPMIFTNGNLKILGKLVAVLNIKK